MRIVIRIGGSIVASPINPDLIKRYVALLENLKEQGHSIAVVVGGGTLAREYIKTAKDLGLTQSDQDNVAISVSRLFALLFLKKLGKLSCDSVSITVENAANCLKNGKIAVMGGLRPGMTTDAVAALIAERVGADLYIKATDQEGIYDKDPRTHSDAVKLDRICFEDLSHTLAEKKHKAGIHQILDPEAVKVLRKGTVKVVIVNGARPENVSAAVCGKKVGTIIEKPPKK